MKSEIQVADNEIGGAPRLDSDDGVRGRGFRQIATMAVGVTLSITLLVLLVVQNGGGVGSASTRIRISLEEEDPSEVSANIIAGAEQFNRKYEQLNPDDPVPNPPNTGAEKDYPAVAQSIIMHGRGVLDRLLHPENYPPSPPLEAIPMPTEDDETEKPPEPPAPGLPDQGAVAASIVEDSKEEIGTSLADADTSGKLPPAKPVVSTPTWKNLGAVPEKNVFAYPAGYIPADAPQKVYKDGRNYWHTYGGENTDKEMGAFGEGAAPGTSGGTGPRINTRTDNGAYDSEGFTINTGVDDAFHGSKPSWLPIGVALGHETGPGLQDKKYLSVMGRRGPSGFAAGHTVTVRSLSSIPSHLVVTKFLGGFGHVPLNCVEQVLIVAFPAFQHRALHSLHSTLRPNERLRQVNVDADNDGAGEQFSFSTGADAFSCGDNCTYVEAFHKPKFGYNATSTALAEVGAPVGDAAEVEHMEKTSGPAPGI